MLKMQLLINFEMHPAIYKKKIINNIKKNKVAIFKLTLVIIKSHNKKMKKSNQEIIWE
jgi:hypothetical protein